MVHPWLHGKSIVIFGFGSAVSLVFFPFVPSLVALMLKKRQTQKQQHQNTQLKTATAPIFWVKFVFLIERVILQIDRNENLIWFFIFTLRPLPNMAYFNIDYCTCQVKCMQQFQEPHWLRTRQFISYSAENWNKMQKLEIKLNYRSVANGEQVSRK